MQKPIFDLFESGAEPDPKGRYAAFIRISPGFFSFLITSDSEQKAEGLRRYAIPLGEDAGAAAMEEIFNKDPWLKLMYKKAVVAVSKVKNTLVPSGLLDKTKLSSFLYFNHTRKTDEEIHSDFLTQPDVHNIFALPVAWESFIHSRFPGAALKHSLSCLISQALNLSKTREGKLAFVNVQEGWFDLLFLNQGNLVFSNSFQFQNSEDLAYYLLFACDRLQFNPEKETVFLTGEVEKNSQLYQLIFKYFRQVETAQRPFAGKAGFKFAAFPSHYFFSEFAMVSCG